MRRLLPILLILTLAACQGESARPVPTGKGGVRMINTLDNAPTVDFLIEERRLENVSARQGSGITRWDDFSYVFNFEVNVLGELQLRRFASQEVAVEADREFALVLTGNIDDPTVSVWETPETDFEGSETFLEARFAHLASAGAADIYLLPPGESPAPGASLGTLQSGEFLDPVDVEGGDYTLIITEAGDPAAVLFRSVQGTFAPRNVATLILLDSTEIGTAPYTVQLIGNNGSASTLRDARFGPEVRLIQASLSLADADVYDDEALTSLIQADHGFGDVTAELPIATGTNSLTYTATGNTSVTLFETEFDADRGLTYNLVVVGDDTSRSGEFYFVDRRSISTEARLLLLQGSLNHQEVDVYATERDAGFTGDGLALNSFDYPTRNTIFFDAREIDLYVTTGGEETVLAGPLPLDFELGDVIEIVIQDAVDPATVELRIIPPP